MKEGSRGVYSGITNKVRLRLTLEANIVKKFVEYFKIVYKNEQIYNLLDSLIYKRKS